MNFKDILDSLYSFRDKRMYSNGDFKIKLLNMTDLLIEDKNGKQIIIPEISHWKEINEMEYTEIPEEWEDKHVREWLDIIKKRDRIGEFKHLKEEYEHWDSQLYLVNEGVPPIDFEGNPFDGDIQDELANVVEKIFNKASLKS